MATLRIISVDGTILIKSPEFIQKKTALDILNSIQQQDEDFSLLAIKTPTYMKILKPDSIPYDSYPGLISDKPSVDLYSIPDFYLQILHNSSKGKFCFIFNPTSPEHPEIIFPPFIFSFIPSDYANKNISDFISDLVVQFGISISNPKIFLNGKEISPELDFRTFFKQVSEYVKKCLYESTSEKMKSIDFQFTIEPKGLKKIQYRENGLKEILDTEESYCSVLRSLNEYFSPLFKEHKILNDTDHEALFGPIPQMIETSVYFSTEMKRLQSYASCVGPAFLSTLFNFKQSSVDYFVNYNLYISEMIESLDANPLVRKICDESPNNPGISFQSIVIQPIQRFPRYPLLLRELLKNTPQSHPDFYLLHQVNRQVESMAHELADAHLVREMSQLKDKLVESNDKDSLFSDERVLMKFFSVKFKEKFKSVFAFIESVKCKLYLFNDMLLLTSGNEKEIEQMRCSIDKFVFIPCFPDNSSITFYANDEFKCIEFSSDKNAQIFKTVLNECREKLFNSDENKHIHSIKAIEYFPSEGQTINPMLDSSCCKLGNFIYSISHRNFNILSLDDHSLTVNDSIKGIHKHSKLAMIKDKKFIFGGSKNIGPFELIDNKVIETKTKNESSDCKLELIKKLGANRINHSKKGRIFHTCCSYDKYIVVFGGINPKNPKKDVFDLNFYSVETDEWFEINNCEVKPEPRYKHSAVIYKDSMIIHGGINPLNDQIMKDTLAFDFLNGKWTFLEFHENDDIDIVPRFGHTAVIVNHYMFVIGGSTAESTHDSSISSSNHHLSLHHNHSKDNDVNDHNDTNNTSNHLFSLFHNHNKDNVNNNDQNESSNHHNHSKDNDVNDHNDTNNTSNHLFSLFHSHNKDNVNNNDQNDSSNHHLSLHHNHSRSLVVDDKEKNDNDNNNNHNSNITYDCTSDHHQHNHHSNSTDIRDKDGINNENEIENKNESLTEQETDNDSSDNFEFDDGTDSAFFLSKNCFPAPDCFCLNIENGKIENIEIKGNFISGISMFSAVYDESKEQIIILGGRDPNKHIDKGLPMITFLDIPKHYVMTNHHLKHSESEIIPVSKNYDENQSNNHKKSSHRPHSVDTIEESNINSRIDHDLFDERYQIEKQIHQHHINKIDNDDENYRHLHHKSENKQLNDDNNSNLKTNSMQVHSLHHHQRKSEQRQQLEKIENDNNNDDNFTLQGNKTKHKSDSNHQNRNFKKYYRPKRIVRNTSVSSNANKNNQLSENIKKRRRSSSYQNGDN